MTGNCFSELLDSPLSADYRTIYKTHFGLAFNFWIKDLESKELCTSKKKTLYQTMKISFPLMVLRHFKLLFSFNFCLAIAEMED